MTQSKWLSSNKNIIQLKEIIETPLEEYQSPSLPSSNKIKRDPPQERTESALIPVFETFDAKDRQNSNHGGKSTKSTLKDTPQFLSISKVDPDVIVLSESPTIKLKPYSF